MDKQLTKVKRGIKKRNLHKNTIKLNRQYNNKIIQSGGKGGITAGVVAWRAFMAYCAKYCGMERLLQTGGDGLMKYLNLMRINVMYDEFAARVSYKTKYNFRDLVAEILDDLHRKRPTFGQLLAKNTGSVPPSDTAKEKVENPNPLSMRLMILGNGKAMSNEEEIHFRERRTRELEELLKRAKEKVSELKKKDEELETLQKRQVMDGRDLFRHTERVSLGLSLSKAKAEAEIASLIPFILDGEVKMKRFQEEEYKRLRILHEEELGYLNSTGQGNQTVATIKSSLVEANTQLRKRIGLYMSLARLFQHNLPFFDTLAYGFYKKPPTGRKFYSKAGVGRERERLFLLLKNHETRNTEIRYYKYSEYNKHMYEKGKFIFKSIVDNPNGSVTINTQSGVDIILNKIPDKTFETVVLNFELKKLTPIPEDELRFMDAAERKSAVVDGRVDLINFNDWFDSEKFRNFNKPLNTVMIGNMLMNEINNLLCVKAIAQHDFINSILDSILENPTTVPEEAVNNALANSDKVISTVSQDIESTEDKIHKKEFRKDEDTQVAASEGGSRPLGSSRSRKHKKYKKKTLKYKKKTLKYKNRGFKKNKKTKNRRR